MNKNKAYGLSRTRAYDVWRGLVKASKNSKYAQRKYGKEILLCREWQGKQGLLQFYQDMGEPAEAAYLRRYDNKQPFSKINCYWSPLNQLTPEKLTILKTVILFLKTETILNSLNRYDNQFVKSMGTRLQNGSYISERSFRRAKLIFRNTPPDLHAELKADLVAAIERLESKQENTPAPAAPPATLPVEPIDYYQSTDEGALGFIEKYESEISYRSTAKWEDVLAAIEKFKSKK